jgi:hypothetical protein
VTFTDAERGGQTTLLVRLAVLVVVILAACTSTPPPPTESAALISTTGTLVYPRDGDAARLGVRERCAPGNDRCAQVADGLLRELLSNMELPFNGSGATDTSGTGPNGSLLVVWTLPQPLSWQAASQGGFEASGTTRRAVVDLGPLLGNASAYVVVDGTPPARYYLPPGLAGQLLQALYVVPVDVVPSP